MHNLIIFTNSVYSILTVASSVNEYIYTVCTVHLMLYHLFRKEYSLLIYSIFY